MAVKTCKKNCTLDNKEKFMSEAGRCPWGDTSTGAKQSQETMQTGKQEGAKASAVEVGEAVDRANIHRGKGCTPGSRSSQQTLILALGLGSAGAPIPIP